MKKFATMLLALLLTAALTVPAMATFTPSSENKDAPEIISATFEDGTREIRRIPPSRNLWSGPMRT